MREEFLMMTCDSDYNFIFSLEVNFFNKEEDWSNLCKKICGSRSGKFSKKMTSMFHLHKASLILGVSWILLIWMFGKRHFLERTDGLIVENLCLTSLVFNIDRMEKSVTLSWLTSILTELIPRSWIKILRCEIAWFCIQVDFLTLRNWKNDCIS